MCISVTYSLLFSFWEFWEIEIFLCSWFAQDASETAAVKEKIQKQTNKKTPLSFLRFLSSQGVWWTETLSPAIKYLFL